MPGRLRGEVPHQPSVEDNQKPSLEDNQREAAAEQEKRFAKYKGDGYEVIDRGDRVKYIEKYVVGSGYTQIALDDLHKHRGSDVYVITEDREDGSYIAQKGKFVSEGRFIKIESTEGGGFSASELNPNSIVGLFVKKTNKTKKK